MKKKPLIIEQHITVGRKKYLYTLQPVDDAITHVKCEAAGIDQDFANEDILEFIMELPDWIIEEQVFQKKRAEEVLRFRCTNEERKAIAKRALQKRFPNVSAYLRALALNGELNSEIPELQLVSQKSTQ